MEGIEKHKKEFVESFIKGLESFERQLLDEIAVRDDPAKETQKSLREAQIAARRDARRIAALERELAYLRAQPDYVDQETHAASSSDATLNTPPLDSRKALANAGTQCELVSAEEFRQLQQNYSRLEQDYGKLAIARNIVEEKLRSSQKMVRKWKAYFDKRGSESRKQTIRNGTISSSTVASSETGGFIRASSAPAYMSLVRQGGPSSESEVVCPTVPAAAFHSNGGSHDNATYQALISTGSNFYQVTSGLENDKAATLDDTEDTTAPDSADEKGREPLQPTALIERVEDDSPVLLSTRAVKRKRYRESPPPNAMPGLPHSKNPLPGTAEKPVHIKSDQSSSPLVVVRSQHLDEHDSMDLDEVGSKTPTPRKRRRHDIVRLPFTICEPLSPTDGHEHDSDRLTRNDTASRQESEKRFRDQSSNVSPSSILDEEACKKKRDQYAALLWAKQQEKDVKPGGFSSVEGSSTPLHIADEPRQKRSFLFNQAVRTRRAKERTDEAHLSADTKGTEIVPKRTICHDQGERARPPTSKKTLHLVGPSGESLSNEAGSPQSILQPADPNILPRTGGLIKRKVPTPSRRDRGCAPVEVLAEDGETKAKSLTHNHHRVSKAPEAEERLESLLAQRQPDKPLLPPETPGAKKRTPLSRHSITTLGGQVDVLTAKNGLTPAASGASNQNAGKNSNQSSIDHRPKKPIPIDIALGSTRPSSTGFLTSTGPKSLSPRRTAVVSLKSPIRNWPREILRREHFKPNPSHNSGYSYAYRESIRNHDERKCLPGCSRPDCCGDVVRKMLAIGGPIMNTRTSLFSPASKAPENDDGVDHGLLKDYMGDNYRCWATMTDKEKQIEWAQAQAWDFSKRYGRHKDSGRQTTPPGYWKVDMASTQEKEQQDEEAEMMERAVVEGRWREAMRKGGAWVFADE
ncbi:MAG: hypothetical protein Q9191_001724 [Dirinaria sp. TL-2023a]